MVARWILARGKHPAYCTCVKCANRRRSAPETERHGHTPGFNQPSPRRRGFSSTSDSDFAQESSSNKRSVTWVIATLLLTTVIVAYLVVVVTMPNDIEPLMESWARVFDGPLSRPVTFLGY